MMQGDEVVFCKGGNQHVFQKVQIFRSLLRNEDREITNFRITITLTKSAPSSLAILMSQIVLIVEWRVGIPRLSYIRF